MENGKQSPLSPEEQLVLDLQDPEYRRAFIEAHATDTVAFQLRALRKEEGWDQKDVAERLGNRKLQPMISRYENPDYGKYSISTLLDLAAVFDVGLIVRFAPFSEVADWDLSNNPNRLTPARFSKDRGLAEVADSGKIKQQSSASLAADIASVRNEMTAGGATRSLRQNGLTSAPLEGGATDTAIGAA